ncbi:MAG: response regulator, partial [Bryobacteraceae bacterium]
MIVEDEPITAEDLRDILTELGYSVTALAASGAEALSQAERTTPDLVLMDIRIIGEMDGIETARRLREKLRVPVIYLTAHADQGTLARAREAEPLGYIVKPFHELELEASIEMALHKARVDEVHRRNRELLSGTLEAIGEGVVSVDAAGLVTLLNPAAERWTGWSNHEAAGRASDEVLQIQWSGDGEHPVSAAVSARRLYELPEGAQLVSRDGIRRPIGGSASPILDHRGEVTGAVLVFGHVASAENAVSAETTED